MISTLQALEAQLSQTQALSEKLRLLDELYQYLRLSDLRRAGQIVEEMLVLSGPAYPVGRGLALKNLGDLHLRLGNLPASQGCLEEALAILRESGEPRGKIRVLNALGSLYCLQGGFSKALEYHLEALEISRNGFVA